VLAIDQEWARSDRDQRSTRHRQLPGPRGCHGPHCGLLGRLSRCWLQRYGAMIRSRNRI